MSTLLTVIITLGVVYLLGYVWYVALTWSIFGGLPLANDRARGDHAGKRWLKQRPGLRVAVTLVNALMWPLFVYRIIKDEAR